MNSYDWDEKAVEDPGKSDVLDICATSSSISSSSVTLASQSIGSFRFQPMSSIY